MDIEVIYKTIPCSAYSKESEGILKFTDKNLGEAKIKCPNHTCSNEWISIEHKIREYLSSGVGEYKGRVVCRGKESKKKGALECSSEVLFTAVIS